MPEPKRPLKVFLCHASTDKPKVRELYKYLKKRGIQPWFDEEDLVGGQDWQVEIPKALATSDAIIICLTKNSVDKEGYIQKEIKFALDKALEMPEGRIFLIPVKFEECEVPFTLSRYQWVDLTVESGYAKMMKALKFRASQLERSTVEVSKKDIDEENLAREKKEREAAERVEKERKEKEFREKHSREARETEKRESEKKEEKPTIVKPKAGSQTVYWFGGFVVLVLGIIFLSSLNNPPSTSQPTPEDTLTQAITSLAQITVEPSATKAPESTSTLSATQTPTSLPTEITDAKGVPMMLVPAGEFLMGENFPPDAWYRDKTVEPLHTIYLDSFYMDKYEVTNALYEACVKDFACEPPHVDYSYNRSSYYGNPQFDDFPVINVDWEQANNYCEWRAVRLPTEAEWEKSARGIDGRSYTWGDESIDINNDNNPNCTLANVVRCGVGDTTKVGIYEGGVSPYGIYDLVGNVSEWVADWYSETYYQNSPSSNPLGPDMGEYRVIRGNGWNDSEYGIVENVYERYMDSPTKFRNDIGFRCAKDVNP